MPLGRRCRGMSWGFEGRQSGTQNSREWERAIQRQPSVIRGGYLAKPVGQKRRKTQIDILLGQMMPGWLLPVVGPLRKQNAGRFGELASEAMSILWRQA